MQCLPEDRVWPGRRCDRCLKYGYICSASRTKSQELARVSRGGSEDSQDTPSSPDYSPEEGNAEVSPSLSSSANHFLNRHPRSEVQW